VNFTNGSVTGGVTRHTTSIEENAEGEAAADEPEEADCKNQIQFDLLLCADAVGCGVPRCGPTVFSVHSLLLEHDDQRWPPEYDSRRE